MANPLADRIEILARHRQTTKLSRAMAGLVLVGAAALTAPLTIAESHPHEDVEKKSVIMLKNNSTWSSDDGEVKSLANGGYEIINEDGEVKAYQITDGGETRTEIHVDEVGEGEYELTLQNGEVVDFSMPDLSGLEGLKGLKGLQGLEGLKGLEAIEGLNGLSGLSGLSELSNLSVLSELEALDLSNVVDGKDVKVIINGEKIEWSDEGALSEENLREKIQNALKNSDGMKSIRVFKHKDGEGHAHLPDTIVRLRGEMSGSDRSIQNVERHLEMTQRQLEDLAEESEEGSDELKKALRELKKAHKSLEKAREEMKAAK